MVKCFLLLQFQCAHTSYIGFTAPGNPRQSPIQTLTRPSPAQQDQTRSGMCRWYGYISSEAINTYTVATLVMKTKQYFYNHIFIIAVKVFQIMSNHYQTHTKTALIASQISPYRISLHIIIYKVVYDNL